MEKKSRVTVISKLTAVSSRPVGAGKLQPLTVLDHAMELHTLHIIIYYKDRLFGSFDLNPFRESLAEALSFYPVVTGRLTRGEDGNWVVKCNDAGVRIFRAQVGTTLDEWLRSADSLEERDLTAWEAMPHDQSTWSSFQIQINEFEGGGVAIGLSCPHTNADPTSVTNLLKSWSDMENGRVIGNPPVFIGLAGSSDRNPHSNAKSTGLYEWKAKEQVQTQVGLDKIGSATFKFSDSQMKHSLSECPNATPFDYLCALFWSRIARIKWWKDEQNISLSISTDSRNLLDLSSNSFGNALHFSRISMSSRELVASGLVCVVDRVHGHVVGLGEDEVWSGIDWLESRREDGGKFGAAFRMYGPELTCVSLEHLICEGKSLAYEAVFEGNLRPVHVSYHFGNSDGEGLFIISPSAENGSGRTVSVMLPEKELARLCEDEAILSLEPEILLTSSKKEQVTLMAAQV